jgi:inosine-uridine nucleoside N-ribohydrolase
LLVELLGKTGSVRVEDGASHMMPDTDTAIDSPGARLIITEAMREGCGPLAIGFQGPLTDMASALILEPRIAERDITVIWIGGDPYDGDGKTYSPEYNLSNDVNAANVVFSSSLTVWQVPMSTYVTMIVSYAELFENVRPCGKIGEYLVDHLVEFNRENPTRRGAAECRSLGDSPVVGLMLNPDCGWWAERPAPGFSASFGYDLTVRHRPIRVYRSIDTRFIIGDFFAKLRAFAQLRGALGSASPQVNGLP